MTLAQPPGYVAEPQFWLEVGFWFQPQGPSRLSLTCLRLGVLGNGAQPVDHIDDKVLLQGEVGVANALRAVNDEDHIQGATALLTVWKCV